MRLVLCCVKYLKLVAKTPVAFGMTVSVHVNIGMIRLHAFIA